MEIKNRRMLVFYLRELGIKNAVEVGVRHGHYSKFILDNTDVNILYAVDPWEENAELDNSQLAYSNCKSRLDSYGKRAIMIKALSPEICYDFEDESIDFIYIDALHDYESVKKDINGWYPKLRYGCIIAGHDYSPRWPGVIQAVNEFVKENSLVLNLTGVGAEDNELEQDGGEPSWWVIKA